MDIVNTCVRSCYRWIRGVYRAQPVRVWLCVAAFVASFGYALIYRIVPSVDARKFHEIAVHLATEGRFCFECNVPIAQDTAIRDIGPGYQFFLASVYRVFGVRIWIVWLLQALMHAIVVWWLAGLIRQILGSRSNHLNTTLPVALYAMHPDIIQSTAMLMSETVFVFLLMCLVKLFIPLWERRGNVSWKWLAGMGVLFGALMMVRPTGLPVLVFTLCVLAWRRWWKAAMMILICAVLIQVPWAIRNERVYNHFVLNSVVGGLDIWVGMDPEGSGEFNLDTLPHITQKIAGLNPDDIDRVSLEEVKTILREKPLFVVGRTVQKGLKLFALTKTSGFWFHYFNAWDRLATLVLSVLFNLALMGAAFAALWDVILKRRLHHWIVGLSIILVALMAVSPTLTVVVNRYRIPMLPFFAILTSVWLAFVQGRDRRNSLIAAAATLTLTTGVDLWGASAKVLERIQRFR